MRIVADRVTYAYPGGAPVFDQFSWRAEPGELWFVVGPSGCGKTTWLRLCLGMVRPQEGRLEVGDIEVHRASPAQLRQLRLATGVVFQEFRLLAGQSAFDNVAVSLRMAGVPRTEVVSRTREALAAVGLADWAEQPVEHLSWGQQQRVAFARAWVRRPRLFLADEPTGNLDAETATAIMDLIGRIHESGATVVVTTHALEQIGRLGGRVLRIEGRTSRPAGDSAALDFGGPR